MRPGVQTPGSLDLKFNALSIEPRTRNLLDSDTDGLKVEIHKLSTDSRINRIGCSILELTVPCAINETFKTAHNAAHLNAEIILVVTV